MPKKVPANARKADHKGCPENNEFIPSYTPQYR
jgi:hypothetical protein